MGDRVTKQIYEEHQRAILNGTGLPTGRTEPQVSKRILARDLGVSRTHGARRVLAGYSREGYGTGNAGAGTRVAGAAAVLRPAS